MRRTGSLWMLFSLVLVSPVSASEVEVEGRAADYGATRPEVAEDAADGVARAVFTTDVVHREPVDEVTTLPLEVTRIHFFTDLRGLAGEAVTHRWERGGEVRAEVRFDVRGPRWRVWSSKELLPGEGGVWTVSVLDGAGNLLASRTLDPPPSP
jgi:hypothetical protein